MSYYYLSNNFLIIHLIIDVFIVNNPVRASNNRTWLFIIIIFRFLIFIYIIYNLVLHKEFFLKECLLILKFIKQNFPSFWDRSNRPEYLGSFRSLKQNTRVTIKRNIGEFIYQILCFKTFLFMKIIYKKKKKINVIIQKLSFIPRDFGVCLFVLNWFISKKLFISICLKGLFIFHKHK